MLAKFQSRHERYVQWIFSRCEQRDMRQLAKKAWVLYVPNAVMQQMDAADDEVTIAVKTYMCGV